jgi:hypothetical protein
MNTLIVLLIKKNCQYKQHNNSKVFLQKLQINQHTDRNEKSATKTILNAFRLLCTHCVDFVDDKTMPAIKAPNADDSPNNAVKIENPKHNVNATKTCIS